MQMGPKKLLRFLPDSKRLAKAGSKPPVKTDSKPQAKVGNSAAETVGALAPLVDTPEQEEAGVILTLQSQAPIAETVRAPALRLDTPEQAAVILTLQSQAPVAETVRAPFLADPEPVEVILTTELPVPVTVAAAQPNALVYSKARKSEAAPDESSDTLRMAAQHQQALERNAGSTSCLSVDKDGVLVAEPASPEEIKARQFMHFAVAAMRDYADAIDRLKTAAAWQ